MAEWDLNVGLLECLQSFGITSLMDLDRGTPLTSRKPEGSPPPSVELPEEMKESQKLRSNSAMRPAESSRQDYPGKSTRQDAPFLDAGGRKGMCGGLISRLYSPEVGKNGYSQLPAPQKF